eukprot:jgi/Mesvir1/423/Mv11305-RA.1
MGLTTQETVALIGAHTVGRMRVQNSGYQGTWVRTDMAFNNEFFVALRNRAWRQITVVNPADGSTKFQYHNGPANSPFNMLPSDMSLLDGDASADGFQHFVDLYAADEAAWQADFAAAFAKILRFGDWDCSDAFDAPPPCQPLQLTRLHSEPFMLRPLDASAADATVLVRIRGLLTTEDCGPEEGEATATEEVGTATGREGTAAGAASVTEEAVTTAEEGGEEEGTARRRLLQGGGRPRPGQQGGAQMRPGQMGPGQMGPGQMGPGQMGPGQPMPDQPRPDQPRPDGPGPDHPDGPRPDQPRPDQPRPDQPRPDHPDGPDGPDGPRPDGPDHPDMPRPDGPKPGEGPRPGPVPSVADIVFAENCLVDSVSSAEGVDMTGKAEVIPPVPGEFSPLQVRLRSVVGAGEAPYYDIVVTCLHPVDGSVWITRVLRVNVGPGTPPPNGGILGPQEDGGGEAGVAAAMMGDQGADQGDAMPEFMGSRDGGDDSGGHHHGDGGGGVKVAIAASCAGVGIAAVAVLAVVTVRRRNRARMAADVGASESGRGIRELSADDVAVKLGGAGIGGQGKLVSHPMCTTVVVGLPAMDGEGISRGTAIVIAQPVV